MHLNEYILLCSVMMIYVDESRKNEWILVKKTLWLVHNVVWNIDVIQNLPRKEAI